MRRPGLRNRTYDSGSIKSQQRSSKRKREGHQTASDGGSPNKVTKLSESGNEGEKDGTVENVAVPDVRPDVGEDVEADEVMAVDLSQCYTGREAEQPPAEPLRAERQKLTASATIDDPLRTELRRRPIHSQPLEETGPSQTHKEVWSQTDVWLPHTRSDTSYSSGTCFKEKHKARECQQGMTLPITSKPSPSYLLRSQNVSVPNLTKSTVRTQRTAASEKQELSARETALKTSSNSWFKGRLFKHLVSGFMLILMIITPLSWFKTRQTERELDFSAILADMKSAFPSQRAEFWQRSTAHLQWHLNESRPTEPASMVLTAGSGAEATLRCVASRVATAFSACFSASVLHIDGASRAALDSDLTKLDIDQELTEAFEGDKMAAVVHRFEELPPASTLIFYKYCDHENAKYKNVLFIFTVLLPVQELGSERSLVEVEEMVQEHIQNQFLSSTEPGAFNQMDYDKLGGLWSRISHLILPVSVEESIESDGCDI